MNSNAKQERNESVEGMIQELLEWFKAVTFSELQATVESALDTDAKRLAYALTAPDRSLREIEDLMEKVLDEHPNFSTIGGWQRDWVQAGLMRQISKQKREPIFDLENQFGMELPVKLEYLTTEDED